MFASGAQGAYAVIARCHLRGKVEQNSPRTHTFGGTGKLLKAVSGRSGVYPHRHYMSIKGCMRGDMCGFAHGEEELRQPVKKNPGTRREIFATGQDQLRVRTESSVLTEHAGALAKSSLRRTVTVVTVRAAQHRGLVFDARARSFDASMSR